MALSKPAQMENNEEMKHLVLKRVQSCCQSNGQVFQTVVKPFESIIANGSLGVRKKYLLQFLSAILLAMKEQYNEIEKLKNDGLISDDCKALIQDIQVFEEYKKQIEDGYIALAVCGRFNTGKSSLINCLLEKTFLPEDDEAETAVRVYIQHDPNIDASCSDPSLHSNPPYMKPFKNASDDSKEVTYGCEKIYSRMKRTNSLVRAKKQKRVDQLLVTNIPVLASIHSMTSGRTLLLIDNPGGGESNEDATALAQLSLMTSQVFLYIIDYSATDEREIIEFLKQRRGQISSNQIIVVVNKFDNFYTTTTSVTVSEKMKRVKSLLSRKLGLPEEGVVLVSSKWKKWSQSYSSECKDEVNHSIRQYSKKIRGAGHVISVSPQHGTGSNQDVETMRILSEGSNFEELEAKLKDLVQTYVSQSDKHLVKTVLDLLKHANQAYMNFSDKEANLFNRMARSVESLELKHKKLLSCLMKLGEIDEIASKLESAYESDTKEPISKTRATLEEMLGEFTTRCCNKGSYPNLRDAKQEAKAFFSSVDGKLTEVINATAFAAMDAVLETHYIQLGGKVLSLDRDVNELHCEIMKILPSALSPTLETLSLESPRHVSRDDVHPSRLNQLQNEIHMIQFNLSLFENIRLLYRKYIQKCPDYELYDVFSLSEEQFKNLLDNLGAFIHDQTRHFFAANKENIKEWYILKYLLRVQYEQERHIEKWNYLRTSANKDISQLQCMASEWKKYLEYIQENRNQMDKLQELLITLNNA